MCVHNTQEFYTKYTSCTFITLAETSVTTPLSKQGMCSYLDRNKKEEEKSSYAGMYSRTGTIHTFVV